MSVQMRVHCLRTGVLILGPKRTRRSRGNPAPNLNKIRQVKDKPNSTIQMSAADIFICLDWSCVCVRVCVCVCVCVLFAHGLGIRIRDVKLWPFDSRKCSCWPRKKRFFYLSPRQTTNSRREAARPVAHRSIITQVIWQWLNAIQFISKYFSLKLKKFPPTNGVG